MPAGDLAGDVQAQPCAAGLGGADEGLEEVLADGRGDARAGVHELDDDDAVLAPALSRDQPAGLAERLGGVGDEVREDAEELIAVGLDLQGQRQVVAPAPALAVTGHGRGAGIEERPQRHPGAAQLRRFAAGEGEGLGAEPGRPLQRLEQPRHHALDLGIVAGVEAVGQQHRRGEDVAEVVVDLADRRPQRREPLALPQRVAHAPLHTAHLALDDAEFVAAGGVADERVGVVRILAKGHHRGRELTQRPDDDPLQEQEQGAGDERRQEQRQGEYPARIGDHLADEPALAEGEVDADARRARGGAEDPHDAILAREYGAGCEADLVPDALFAEIVDRCRRRHGAEGERAGAVADDDADEPRLLEQAAFGRGVEHGGGIGEQHGGCQMRRRQLLGEILHAKAGDRGNVDQDLAEENEPHGDRQETGAQTPRGRRHGDGVGAACHASLVRGARRAQPSLTGPPSPPIPPGSIALAVRNPR